MIKEFEIKTRWHRNLINILTQFYVYFGTSFIVITNLFLPPPPKKKIFLVCHCLLRANAFCWFLFTFGLHSIIIQSDRGGGLGKIQNHLFYNKSSDILKEGGKELKCIHPLIFHPRSVPNMLHKNVIIFLILSPN